MSIDKFSTDCVIERLAWNLSDFTFAEPVGREIMWLVSHLQNYATFRLASLFEAFRESWHQHILISEKPAANEIPRIVRTQTKAKELTGPDLCRSPSKSDNIWVSASSSEIECPKSVVKCPRRLLHPYRHDESARVHIWLMTSSAKAKIGETWMNKIFSLSDRAHNGSRYHFSERKSIFRHSTSKKKYLSGWKNENNLIKYCTVIVVRGAWRNRQPFLQKIFHNFG